MKSFALYKMWVEFFNLMKIDLSIINRKEKELPLFVQFKDLLRGAIASGIYKPGEKLESERELIESSQLSYPTISRALKELAEEGWITRKIGSGTFVSGSYQHGPKQLKKIAVLYYDTTTPAFEKMFAGILRQCNEYEIEPVRMATGINDVNVQKIMDELNAQAIDGIIALPFGSIELAVCFTKLVQKKFPIVIAGTYFHLLRCDSVAINDEKGAYEVTKHLLRLGHKKLVFIGSIPRYPFSMVYVDTQKGITAALKEGASGAEIDSLLFPVGINEESPQFTGGVAALFDDPDKAPTAIICEGEAVAREAYRILQNIGLSVPKNVSVVSFGNFHYGLDITPRLTVVDWPFERVGAEAVKLIVSKTIFPNQPMERIVIDPSLIIRESTASPPKE
jgi:DNA-binding LacI/PurR family transcriptional regulator